jgi:hypothetical protein
LCSVAGTTTLDREIKEGVNYTDFTSCLCVCLDVCLCYQG